MGFIKDKLEQDRSQAKIRNQKNFELKDACVKKQIEIIANLECPLCKGKEFSERKMHAYEGGRDHFAPELFPIVHTCNGCGYVMSFYPFAEVDKYKFSDITGITSDKL